MPEDNNLPDILESPTHYLVVSLEGSVVEFEASDIEAANKLYIDVARAGRKSIIKGIIKEEENAEN